MNKIDDFISVALAYFFEQHKPITNKAELINILIKLNRYHKYLEVGVEQGINFNQINCETKISVDPVQLGATTHVMTSDEYFANLSEDEKFDIIFIDGLHEYETCYRDINNSLKHLNKNGIIICHDMNPLCKEFETGNNEYYVWNGDVWKSFVRIRSERDDIESCMIENFDYGVGIIKFGHSEPLKLYKPINEYTFEDFDVNKKLLMNTITLQQFKDKYFRIGVK